MTVIEQLVSFPPPMRHIIMEVTNHLTHPHYADIANFIIGLRWKSH